MSPFSRPPFAEQMNSEIQLSLTKKVCRTLTGTAQSHAVVVAFEAVVLNAAVIVRDARDLAVVDHLGKTAWTACNK